MSVPAVVLKTQFTLAKSSTGSFSKFINYVDRENTRAQENDFSGYQDYMSDDEKSSGIFTDAADQLNESEKDNVKEIFRIAESKRSIMWQDVISFDNDFLKHIGVLKTNGKEQFLDEVKLKQATRKAINAMWKKEGIHDSVYWTAAIHYNTDNIHIHVASVQTRNFRFRGKRKQQSLDLAKSLVIHTLVDRSKENEKLNDFIRNKVIHSMKAEKLIKPFDLEMRRQFKFIYDNLPNDKRNWQYAKNEMKNLQPQLNKLTDMYIEKHFPKEFDEFKKTLDEEVKIYEKMYGKGSRAEQYRTTKMNDLYKRCGNTILSEMKEYDKKVKLSERQALQSKKVNATRAQFNLNCAANRTLYRINRLMRDDIEHIKNQREFERFEYEREMNRS